MGGETEMEVADQSCDGGGQDKLRKRHAYTGARPSPKGQRPPHLLIKAHHFTKAFWGREKQLRLCTCYEPIPALAVLQEA